MPEHRLTSEIGRAVCRYCLFAWHWTGNDKDELKSFIGSFPAEARALAEFHDTTYSGVNHFLKRRLFSVPAKVRIALEDARESTGCKRRRGRWVRRHAWFLCFMAMILLLPMVNSPTHPLAVYGYLFDSYGATLLGGKVYAATDEDLGTFLLTPSQVERYRTELLADALDRTTGKFFVIIRSADGTLNQKAIRTWNGFLPAGLPAFLTHQLDRMEVPFLGDEVETWMRGDTIVATGHYHAFGGGPSTGDKRAQGLARLPEVVIANGVIPSVYLDGDLLPYGKNVEVSEVLFKHLRTLDRSLTMEVDDSPVFVKEPSQGLESFLAYLRDYRYVDIRRNQDVALETYRLCLEFKSDYRGFFSKGYTLAPYLNDPDICHLLRNLASLQCWAEIYSAEQGPAF